MTKYQKHKRALRDAKEILETRETRLEFATGLFELDHAIRAARTSDRVFDAAMTEAEERWNQTSVDHAKAESST